MSKDILFDNIIITEELYIAEQWAADTFDKKRQKIAKDSVSFFKDHNRSNFKIMKSKKLHDTFLASNLGNNVGSHVEGDELQPKNLGPLLRLLLHSYRLLRLLPLEMHERCELILFCFP